MIDQKLYDTILALTTGKRFRWMKDPEKICHETVLPPFHIAIYPSETLGSMEFPPSLHVDENCTGTDLMFRMEQQQYDELVAAIGEGLPSPREFILSTFMGMIEARRQGLI